MGMESTGNCNQQCRYHYRGRCAHSEPSVYVEPGTALCLEKAEALLVEAEAIAAEAWRTWRSDYAKETERLALLADEERSGIDWTAIAGILSCALFWTLVVVAVARAWR